MEGREEGREKGGREWKEGSGRKEGKKGREEGMERNGTKMCYSHTDI